MRWIAKAAIQKLLAAMPAEERLNYVFQRHVTHRLPRDTAGVAQHVEEAARHIATLREHGSASPVDARCYEFGAGWDMIGPLTLWTLGVESQTVIDLRHNMHAELIAHTLTALPDHVTNAVAIGGSPARELPREMGGDLIDSLRSQFGIDYRAPCDARATGFPPESFDLVSSTFVLEHVPAADVTPILVESRRLLRPGGIISCTIDMQDHHAFFDPSVSVYNYLQFSDRVWAAVNSSLHFQNRLRLSDYVKSFEAAGLEIVELKEVPVTPADRKTLEGISLARRFRAYDWEDLAVREALVVACAPS